MEPPRPIASRPIGSGALVLAPSAITDLDATAISATRVDLTWTPATNATSHRVERATVG